MGALILVCASETQDEFSDLARARLCVCVCVCLCVSEPVKLSVQ
jgi:hypothetical protein